MKLSKVCFHNCYYEKFGNNEPVKIDDLPFNIPDSWMWIRLGMSCKLIGTGIEFFKGEKQYYSTGSIKENNFVPEGSYNFHNRPSRANRIAVMGELIDAKMQNTVKVQIIDNRLAGSLLSTGFYVLKNYINNIEYIKFLILSNYFQKSKDKKCSGTTQKAITDEELSSIIIPLPPLEEQQRIVDKINSFEPLLEKYDKVEKELSKLEKEFPEKLKRSILQYAIEGKLVNQDPDDEPASVLLERIKQEKERLIKEGKIKRDKNESNIYQGDDKNYYEKIGKALFKIEVPFDIPNKWLWVKSHQIMKPVQYGYNGPGLSNGKVKLLRITDIQNGNVNWNTLPYCNISESQVNIYQIKKNDIYIARTGGTIGKSFRLDMDMPNVVFAGYLIRFSFIEQKISKYINLFLNTPLYWNQVADKSAGTGQPNINGVSLSNLLVPIPSYSEQERILNKINYLFQEIDY